MRRMLEYTNYEVEKNGHLKNPLAGNKKIKALVGKDILVRNKHNAELYLIQNAELKELEEVKEGLLLVVVKDEGF